MSIRANWFDRTGIIAILLASLAITSGCLGSIGQSESEYNDAATVGNQKSASASNQTTIPATESATPTDRGTAVVTTTSGQSTSNATTTPQHNAGDADPDNSQLSSYARQFVEFSRDNSGELMNVEERGDLLAVNYTLPDDDRKPSLRIDAAVADYVVDIDSVVGSDLRDNSSTWDVDTVSLRYHFPNGTFAGYTVLRDYWFEMRRQYDEFDLDKVNEMSSFTQINYQWEADAFDYERREYVQNMNESMHEEIEGTENVTLLRSHQTLFLRFHSRADTRAELNDQLRQAMTVYKNYHDETFAYRNGEPTYSVAGQAAPLVMDVTVSWEGHGDFLMSRVAPPRLWEDGERQAEPTADEYYEALMDNAVYERGRFRDQP